MSRVYCRNQVPFRVLSLLRLAIVTTVCTLGAMLLTLLLVVRLGPVPSWWPLLAADTFALYAFAPFLAVAVAALLFWSRTLLALTALALVFFLQQFGGPLLSQAGVTGPAVATAGEGRQRIRVLTMNLHSPNGEPLPFIELIRKVNPDVIMFQELTDEFERSFNRQMGSEYLFSATVGTTTDHEGSGTWSRYPLLDREQLRPSRFGNAMHRVRLSLGQATGQPDPWLYNVHLPNPTGDDREGGRLATLQRYNTVRRDFELRWLIEDTETLDVPYVLAGDFNIAAGSYGNRLFPPGWQDVYARAGKGFGNTFPAPAHEAADGGRVLIPFPLIRIDYVLGSAGVLPVQAWVEELPASDHFGVVADIEF
jgi:endonuclease/exonuclease/phosphatase (EEP) superfamily protein YafD